VGGRATLEATPILAKGVVCPSLSIFNFSIFFFKYMAMT
jgi:hypothetical protein